jgi:hypothetical protein
MKTKQDYIKDITEIRSMMERSTRFLSLTGWSGILAGIYALMGAAIAYTMFYTEGELLRHSTLGREEVGEFMMPFFVLATMVLILALGTAVLLSWRRAKKNNEVLWNAAARRLVINLAIPLLTGGAFAFILYSKGFIVLIAPITLIFYGLALLNASKFTFEEVRYFGVIEIILGLIATWFIGYGLLFWAVGFGLMHIVYGIYMHLKYER